MTDGNAQAIAQYLNEREEWDALQEVTVELEQAEARIEELEAKLAKAVDALKYALQGAEWSYYGINFEENYAEELATLAELKGETDE